MRKTKMYLDTSIINFAIDERDREKNEITKRLIDEIHQDKYEVYISEVVILEIKRADKEKAEKLMEVVKDINPEELPIEEEIQILASKYIETKIMPDKYKDDALHIAVASVNNLDVLVSWNFGHII